MGPLPPVGALSEGEAQLASLDALTPDPRNARRHDERNVGLIEHALADVGAARSVVIDEAGVILAGNATVEAARAAGLKLRVIEGDAGTLVAVRRADLSAEQKTRLALYDNRAAELAGWDVAVIQALRAEHVDLGPLWTVDELARWLPARPGDAGEETKPALGGVVRYRIIVDCRDEAHQAELLERFDREGLPCRTLML